MTDRTPSATSPYVKAQSDKWGLHWVTLDSDPNDPRGEHLTIWSHDIDEVIEELQAVRQRMADAGARMEVDLSWPPAAGAGG